MTTTEYVQSILDERQDDTVSENIREELAYETAQLLSGSFTYRLYGALWADFYDLEAINKHLELKNSNNKT